MARAPIKLKLSGAGVIALLSVLLMGLLVMMMAAAQNSLLFGRIYTGLLIASVSGVVLLAVLLAVNLQRLTRQLRADVPGARLTLRLFSLILTLAVIPVTIVYLFSVQSFGYGIDHWFDVRIDRALEDAMALGQSALRAEQREAETRAVALAGGLDARSADLLDSDSRRMERFRTQYRFDAVRVRGPTDDILVSTQSSSAPPLSPPDREDLDAARAGQTRSRILPDRGGLSVHVLTPLSDGRLIEAAATLPAHHVQLGENVQAAFTEYRRLLYLRGPLKFGFLLTLSLVALMTLLLALWAAVVTARRLTHPIRTLVEGTRAVARGDFRRQLPAEGPDELGQLIASFNEMTRRVGAAQHQIREKERVAETERARLDTVLTHLSSGVLLLDTNGRLSSYNVSAERLLGPELCGAIDRPVGELGALRADYAELATRLSALLATPLPERQEPARVSLAPESGRRTLNVRVTRLPTKLEAAAGGYVVVLEDVTTLLAAERQAAWSEVARRMAHEIKNPLTPIQLSAERMRRKCLDVLPEPERDTLDRATHTIIQQVDTLKHLVNAFSDYARLPPLDLKPLALNSVVRELLDLYRERLRNIEVTQDTDPRLTAVLADGARLRQVLHNLLINACDALAGAEHPRLMIETQLVDGAPAPHARIVIRDNGPGFDARVRERMFEPYVTTKEKGTGLGLAIVRRIVVEHHGDILVMNPAEGGAEVSITLPLAPIGTDREVQTA